MKAIGFALLLFGLGWFGASAPLITSSIDSGDALWCLTAAAFGLSLTLAGALLLQKATQ